MGESVFIYHITHVDNLPGVIAAGGLRCDRLRARSDDAAVCIAHQHIKDRRARRAVPCAARGFVSDYVPFYFAPRSPMLYTIHKGNVEAYKQGQRPILHLVSTMQDAVALGRPWCFTDGHAEVVYSAFYDDLRDLDKIDWSVMRSKMWNDTPEAPDRKRRRQAEFLVHDFFPWTTVRAIGVIDAEMKDQVTGILGNSTHSPSVCVKRNWYYD